MNNHTRSRTYEWEDPLQTAAKAQSMSGFDFLNGILNGSIPPPPLAQTLDFQPLSLEPGKVVFRFEPKEFHYNPIGMVHGGVISTVLDTALGCALHSMLAKGVGYTTLELKVNFIKAVTISSGMLKAEGRLIHQGKSTGLAEADLKDEKGRLYAHATSTFMLFNA
ncbi:MAG: PaaI family thioesterase [Chitinophagaceae bacterium]|nr:MAG: PaaI family thioesterase [Chitinophagaceae bacterium]